MSTWERFEQEVEDGKIPTLNQGYDKRSIRWKVRGDRIGWCYVWAPSRDLAVLRANPHYRAK